MHNILFVKTDYGLHLFIKAATSQTKISLSRQYSPTSNLAFERKDLGNRNERISYKTIHPD